MNTVMPPRCLTSVKKSQQNELVVTYSQASRGLLWTEFVPKHKAEEELKRSENTNDTARADSIRKALEDCKD